jgi:hypothetical protein
MRLIIKEICFQPWPRPHIRTIRFDPWTAPHIQTIHFDPWTSLYDQTIHSDRWMPDPGYLPVPKRTAVTHATARAVVIGMAEVFRRPRFDGVTCM